MGRVARGSAGGICPAAFDIRFRTNKVSSSFQREREEYSTTVLATAVSQLGLFVGDLERAD